MTRNNHKVATLVPRDHLDEIDGDHYFMALSYAADDPTYCSFFKQQSMLGRYVIVDNSAVEMGAPEPFTEYVEKAVKLGANMIMLPDIFRNPAATIAHAKSAVGALDGLGLDWMDVMVIPQGNTISEWMECAQKLIEVADVLDGPTPTIGISARYTDLFGGSRLPLVLLLADGRMNRKAPNIHMLGCYADPRTEIHPLMNYTFFKGVDSSYAAVYASNGYELIPEVLAGPRPARHIDFINDKYDPGLLRANIKVWRDACQNGWE